MSWSTSARRLLLPLVAVSLGSLITSGVAEDEDAFYLDGARGGLVGTLQAGHDWSRSHDFTVELWHRPERKAKDDHEEQCLLSHGSWQGRFKLSVRCLRVARRQCS